MWACLLQRGVRVGSPLALVDVGRRGEEGVGALVLDERLDRAGVCRQLRLLAEEGFARVVALLPELWADIRCVTSVVLNRHNYVQFDFESHEIRGLAGNYS